MFGDRFILIGSIWTSLCQPIRILDLVSLHLSDTNYIIQTNETVTIFTKDRYVGAFVSRMYQFFNPYEERFLFKNN